MSIATPTQGQLFFVNGTIKVTATASSTDSTISNVEYSINGEPFMQKNTSPYTWNTASDAPANWVLTATATAKNGNMSTSAPVSVSIVQDVAPVVSITSPSDGTVYPSKPTVPLAATASSQYSTIGSVAFYQGSTLIKKVTAAPYSFNWSKPAAGTYTLTAVATDAQGLATTSASISITVD